MSSGRSRESAQRMCIPIRRGYLQSSIEPSNRSEEARVKSANRRTDQPAKGARDRMRAEPNAVYAKQILEPIFDPHGQNRHATIVREYPGKGTFINLS